MSGPAFFGAALGNVVRGLPLDASGSFFEPLWTNFRLGSDTGILDWYTIIGGVLALIALALHGSLYLANKTEGDLAMRALRCARNLWTAVFVVTLLSLPATVVARPNSLENYRSHPLAFIAPIAVLVGLGTIFVGLRRSAALISFLGSCLYLAAMLIGAAAGLFPVLLPSVGDQGQDVTIARALAGPHTLHVGLAWWSLGMFLALLYFSIVYWLFRGKVSQHAEGYGH